MVTWGQLLRRRRTKKATVLYPVGGRCFAARIVCPEPWLLGEEFEVENPPVNMRYFVSSIRRYPETNTWVIVARISDEVAA